MAINHNKTVKTSALHLYIKEDISCKVDSVSLISSCCSFVKNIQKTKSMLLHHASFYRTAQCGLFSHS